MFKDLGHSAYRFSETNYTYNHHIYGVLTESYEKDEGLKSFWKLTSKSWDYYTARWFAASMEAINYPFFGTQFHPEKPSSLWVDASAINHTWESINLNDHFSKLFVEMARANPNTFGTFADTQKYEVSNYDIMQTKTMADVYVFK